MARVTLPREQELERVRRLNVLVRAVLFGDSVRTKTPEPLDANADRPARAVAVGRSALIRDHRTFWRMFSILSAQGYPTVDDS